MASKIFQTMKKHELIKTEGVSAEKLAELEKDFEEIENEWAKNGVPETKEPEKKEPEKKETEVKTENKNNIYAISPEAQKILDELKAQNEKLTKRLDERDASEKSAAEKAQQEEYTQYVTQLAKEGKITAARKKDLLSEEMVKANAPALKSFKIGTADLKPDPKIAADNQQEGTPAKKEPEQKTQQQPDNNPRPFGGAVDVDKITNDAKSELAAIL